MEDLVEQTSNMSLSVIDKLKPTSIARPDVVLSQPFMTQDMLNIVRPPITIDMEKLPLPCLPNTPNHDRLPSYVNRILDAYSNGMRYKEFRSLLRKADRREKKKNANKITICKDKVVSFE